MNIIIRAAQFAAEKHAGQFRKFTGAPYITHPIRVAGRVTMHEQATPELVAAAWLHDVPEDTDATIEDIYAMFGDKVGMYVNWLTNPSKGSKEPRHIRKKLDREHAAVAPLTCKIIKLIDRIDNLREIDPTDKFTALYCRETLLLAPLLRDADESLYEELIGVVNDLYGKGVDP